MLETHKFSSDDEAAGYISDIAELVFPSGVTPEQEESLRRVMPVFSVALKAEEIMLRIGGNDDSALTERIDELYGGIAAKLETPDLETLLRMVVKNMLGE